MYRGTFYFPKNHLLRMANKKELFPLTQCLKRRQCYLTCAIMKSVDMIFSINRINFTKWKKDFVYF